MPVTTAMESSVEPSSTTTSSQSWWPCACTDSMAARTTVARFHSGITMLTSGWPSVPVSAGPVAVNRSDGRSGVVRGACRQPISLRQRFTAAVLAAYTSPRVSVGAPGAAGSTDSGVAVSSQPTNGPSRASSSSGWAATIASRSTSGCGEAFWRTQAWLRYQSSGLRPRGGRPNRGSRYSAKNNGCGEVPGADR